MEQPRFLLETIDARGPVVMDANREGRVGAALSIPKKMKVTESGVKGDGTFAWARITTNKGPIVVRSVYAPNQRTERIELWRWLADLDAEDHWIFGGVWWICGMMWLAPALKYMGMRVGPGTNLWINLTWLTIIYAQGKEKGHTTPDKLGKIKGLTNLD